MDQARFPLGAGEAALASRDDTMRVVSLYCRALIMIYNYYYSIAEKRRWRPATTRYGWCCSGRGAIEGRSGAGALPRLNNSYMI